MNYPEFCSCALIFAVQALPPTIFSPNQTPVYSRWQKIHPAIMIGQLFIFLKKKSALILHLQKLRKRHERINQIK